MDAAFEVARLLGTHGAQSVQMYANAIKELEQEVSKRQAALDAVTQERDGLKAQLAALEQPQGGAGSDAD